MIEGHPSAGNPNTVQKKCAVTVGTGQRITQTGIESTVNHAASAPLARRFGATVSEK